MEAKPIYILNSVEVTCYDMQINHKAVLICIQP